MSKRGQVGNPELSIKRVGDSRLHVVNRFLRYREDDVVFPGGATARYTYVDDEFAACGVVALDKIRGRRSVLLIRQERYPSQTVGWEIIAGGPDGNEDQLQAAQRELAEEGGVAANLWHELPRQIENVGRGNSRADTFLAADITEVEAAAEPTEVITDRRWFSMSAVEDLMLAGEISSGHTLASLALANAFLSQHPDNPIAVLTT